MARIYTLIISMILLSVKAEPNENWEKHMRKVEELAQKQKVTEGSNKSIGRAIGIPHFGIDFEQTPKATSVHALRPSDIDVVGAMGDSITAANGAGASTVAGLAIEYRSISFSIGGEYTLQESITLPNILKHFNPKIDGYSYENGPQVRQYPYGFNVAVPGARAKDMPDQAERLIEKLKTDNRTKYETDWKLITIFIGGNDLCAIGRDEAGTTPQVYVDEIRKALDMLHAEVPRMFINIADIMEIYVLPEVGYGYGATETCRSLQQSLCGYVVDTLTDPAEQERLIAINKQYQVQLQDLIDSERYDTRDDFTVVIQPFLRDTVLPYTEDGQVDATYFAPDCFHFSDIGHAMGAANLWNNMLEPVGNKTTVWNISNLKIPTKDHPFIFTSKNSESEPTEPEPEPESNSDDIPIWLIVVLAILIAATAAELVALICVIGHKTKEDKFSKTKAVYSNELAQDEKI